MDGIERRYYYSDEDEFWDRMLQRLQDDLGFDPDDAELIMRLRRQMVDMQRQIHHLEAQLRVHEHRRGLRINQYRQYYYEAVWSEEEE